MAACRRATIRLGELAARYGGAKLTRIMDEVLDYSERLMRDALTRLPDGEGRFEDVCDGDGILEAGETEDRTFTIRMHVAKSGDRMRVDFTGSDQIGRASRRERVCQYV